MKKLLGSLALFLALGGSASAQNPTAVTGTITDPGSVAYYPAQVTACLSPVTIRPTVGGQLVNPNIGTNYCIGPVSTAINGSFSMGLHANANITPGATTWIFTVTTLGSAPPAGTGAQTFQSSGITISGASQDVGATLSALAPKLLSGGSSVSPNSPISANQAQGPTYNVLNYAGGLTINDAQHVRDGVTAGGVKTISSATANFQTTAKVGQFITCVMGGSALMPVGSKIVTINSNTLITTDTNDLGAGSSGQCVWYSNPADAAIRAAILAATPTNATSGDPNSKPTLGNSGSAYCPAGGYAINVNLANGALMTYAGSGATIGPNFIGEGKTKCILYILPNSTDPGGPTVINLTNSGHSIIGGFSIDGLGAAMNFTHPIVGFVSVQHSRLYDVEITNISANMGNLGTLDFTNSTDIMGENIFVQGASTGKNDFACGFFGVSSSHFKNLTCSNHNQTAFFGSGGGVFRGVGGDNGPVFENATFDECGSATLDCTIFVAGYANFYGGWIGVGNTGRNAMNVDATSRVWLSNVNCGQFGSTNVVTNCMTIASGGEVNSTMSDLRGNGSGANGVAVTGPAGAKFNSIGGNRIRNCVSAVCTDITAATYATQGFTGGIVPKSSETHTPNTCYAVTGNLLATAQNLCIFLNDQNYQVLNITAQSGGTTPANSACATPPVITLSDGTRTATLTMTTAKTQWSSAVDASTVNSVFATGTTLTVSIGANTCATPPVNVAVSYVLQSVLNP